MLPRDRTILEFPRKLLAIGWGSLALFGPMMALADDGLAVPTAVKPGKTRPCGIKTPGHRHGQGCGTLGYGPPGLHEGFQGFGLGFHAGYGYGGKALGVGAEGGYPFYGGPGYPHPGPCLNRLGHEKPFAYNAGPGYPSAEHPNVFGAVAPLASDQPVIEIGDGPGEADYGSGYGAYTGLLPYPETTFAPFTTAIGTAGSDAGVGAPVPPGPALSPPRDTPPPTTPPTPPSASRSPGLETEPTVNSAGLKGLKVTKIQAGGAAEKAGLSVGDEIRSANNYVTENPADLTWVVTKASPNDVLRVNVRSASGGRTRILDVRLR